MRWNNGNGAKAGAIGSSLVNASRDKHKPSQSIIASRTPRYTTEEPLPLDERLSLTREHLPTETVVEVRHKPGIVFTQMDGYRRIDIVRA